MPTVYNLSDFNITLEQFNSVRRVPVNVIGYAPEVGSISTVYNNGPRDYKVIAVHEGIVYSVPVN